MLSTDTSVAERRRPGWSRYTPWAIVLLLGSSMSPAWALLTIDFNFGALTITDNLLGFDSNGAVGIIDFNTTVGNYSLQGTVDVGVAGPNQVALIGSPSANIRLTNFTAEALVNGAGPLDLQFFDIFPGLFIGSIGADSMDPYVGHATGAPVPAAQDTILNWQGFVAGIVIANPFPNPPPFFNPFLPASSVPLPYTVFGHGPTPLPAFTNPVVGGYLTFDLGGIGDQLILYTSAEVGFTAVPEPGTFVLGGLAVAGLGVVVARRRRN